MPLTGETLALAVMDDDGFGSAITTTDEERQEAGARKLGGVPPEDRMVPITELKELWAELKARGELWNGMTNHYLAERYGDRLYHVRGGGWCRPGQRVLPRGGTSRPSAREAGRRSP